MSKKPVQIVEDYSPPRALIIDGGPIAHPLSDSLSEYGCQIVVSETEKISGRPALPAGRFDYIFQFDNSTLVEKVVTHHLKTTGKFLLIITNQAATSKFTTPSSVKILKVGDVDLWDKKDLTTKIFQTMFSTTATKVVNVWKGSSLTSKKPLNYYSSRESRRKVGMNREVLQERTIKKEISSTPPSIVQKTFFKKRLFFLGLIIFVLISLAAGGIYWYASSLKKIFSNFQTHSASGDLDNLAVDIRQAKEKLKMAQMTYDLAYKTLVPFREVSFMQEAGSLLFSANNLLTLGNDVLAVLTNRQVLFSSSSFSDSQRKIEAFTQTVIESQKQLKAINLPFFPKESYLSFMDSFLDKLSSIHQVLPIIGQLAAGDKEMTYLLLFQNNMELRATGGFIGSFALMTLDKGRMVEFKILDVYDADGQLKGHVEPPKQIRTYLAQPNFFLRDSNFDPDFAVSAALASWFLQKELGTSVDGVIGINLFFVQDMLRILGPLTIADFGSEIVTSDNFFFKAQSFTQKDFFPGSTQKKDFLKAVANGLQTKIASHKNLPLFELVAEVKNALERKNILLYSTDSTIQKLIEEKGWGGRMVEVNCTNQSLVEAVVLDTKSCLPDYLSIIETNFGVNKANYFISKSVAVEKKIDSSGQMVNLVTLSYENKNIPEIFSGGTYVNYLRLFVPLGSVLLGVTLNNVPIAPTDIDVESYETDKTAFGFLVKVAPDNKAVVKVTYKLARNLSADISSYQFFYQKQAGDKNAPLLISITKPAEFKLQPLNFKSTTSREEEIFYATDTSVDRIFAFSRVAP